MNRAGCVERVSVQWWESGELRATLISSTKNWVFSYYPRSNRQQVLLYQTKQLAVSQSEPQGSSTPIRQQECLGDRYLTLRSRKPFLESLVKAVQSQVAVDHTPLPHLFRWLSTRRPRRLSETQTLQQLVDYASNIQEGRYLSSVSLVFGRVTQLPESSTLTRTQALHRLWDKLESKIYSLNQQELMRIIWAHSYCAAQFPPQYRDRMGDQIMKMDMNAADCASVFYALGRTKLKSQALQRRMCVQAIKFREELQGQNICNMLWTCAAMRWDDVVLLDFLSQELVGKANSLSPKNIANAFWAYVTLDHKHIEACQALIQVSKKQLNSFSELGLALTLWACTKLKLKDKELFLEASKILIAKAPDLNEQGLVFVLYAYSKQQTGENDKLLNIMALEVLAKLKQFSLQNLVGITYSFYRANHIDATMFQHIAQRIMQKQDQLTPQMIANILGAFQSGCVSDVKFYYMLSNQIKKHIHAFGSQDVANVIKNYYIVQQKKEDSMLGALAKRASDIMGKFNDSALTDTVLGFDAANYRNQRFFRLAVQHACIQLLPRNQFRPQFLLQFLEALSRAGMYNDNALKLVEQKVSQKQIQLDLQQYVQISQIFADFRYFSPILFKELLYIQQQNTTGLGALGLLDLIYTHASMNMPLNDAQHIILNCRRYFYRLNSSQLFKLLWSAAFFNEFSDQDWWKSGIKQIQQQNLNSNPNQHHFSNAEIEQLNQIILRGQDSGMSQDLQNDLQQLVPQSTQNQIADQEYLPSLISSDIFKILSQTGYKCELNRQICRGLKVDVAVDFESGFQIGVVVGEPSQFSSNQPYRMLGMLCTKNKLLQSRGWKVVNIPWYSWHNLGPEISKKQECLAALLYVCRQQQIIAVQKQKQQQQYVIVASSIERILDPDKKMGCWY
eukprot:TRINITY_DN2367_c0_g2_i1.p1 TRINITY_DN2367_c0_g2~~TRINITY_DN2367_c0_g2_i1.p1  ORF type:complete len:902 (-),score=134.88 TRINITY_DN2367_c0_g2_i1:533-3238(-)